MNSRRRYEKAAQAGDGPAQNNVGQLYRDGRGVPQDLPQAVYWFSLSAAAGYIEGMKNLAHAYAAGEGVAPNEELAAYWQQLAQQRQQ